MNSEINIRDVVHCLLCDNYIVISKETLDPRTQRIICPYCKCKIDIQLYCLYGRKMREL